MRRLLAVASGGGHWDELVLLRDAFDGFEVIYATTLVGQAERHGIQAHLITDSNRHTKRALVRTTVELCQLIWRYRPEVIITTGAMPGLLAVILGKVFRIRTIWLDSVANAEELSLSGQLARKFVDLHLTQWEHLADQRTLYIGSVL